MAEETEPRAQIKERSVEAVISDSQNDNWKNAKTTKLQSGYELLWSSRSLQLGGSTEPSPASSSFFSHTTFGGLLQAICHFRDLIVSTGPCMIASIEHSGRKIYGYTHVYMCFCGRLRLHVSAQLHILFLNTSLSAASDCKFNESTCCPFA